jgi:predicted RND superfamily exporter protein
MTQQQKQTTPVDKLISFIVKRRKRIEIFFGFFIVFSIFSNFLVGTNYDLTKYLPKSSKTKQAIDLMEKEFGYPGTARVMIENVTIHEAQSYKDKMIKIEGVDQIIWADSIGDIYVGQDFINNQDLSDYYKDDNALMDVTFIKGDADPLTYSAIDEIKNILGEKGRYAGPALGNKTLLETSGSEIPKTMVFAVIIIFLILTLTTTSWFEPILFMLIMGIAILINKGTNLIFGEISFLSASIASILQLAVAMDYSIFLLHAFSKEKSAGINIDEAMKKALHSSTSSIITSGITTIIGFSALALMQFQIGRDIGFVLAKSIVCSLITVIFLMPALIIRFNKIIQKTHHRPFIPDMNKLAKINFKFRYLIAIFTILLIIPAYVGQGMINFMYGSSAIGAGEGTQAFRDEKLMDQRFGQSNTLIALIPNNNQAKENELVQSIEDLDYVKNIMSISSILPEGISKEFLPKKLTKKFFNKKFSRIIINVKSDSESELAFKYSSQIKNLIREYYSDEIYFAGMTPTTKEIKKIIIADYRSVNLISILGVALVIFLASHSFFATLAIIIPIEVAIYFNTVLPFIYGEKLAFLGFLMICSIQLGATVDYSILLSNNYFKIRQKEKDRKKAAVKAISESTLSILTSGIVLTVVGYGLYFISSISTISDLGRLIGRGAFMSIILVLTLLPFLLTLFDKLIMKEKSFIKKLTQKYAKNK